MKYVITLLMWCCLCQFPRCLLLLKAVNSKRRGCCCCCLATKLVFLFIYFCDWRSAFKQPAIGARERFFSILFSLLFSVHIFIFYSRNGTVLLDSRCRCCSCCCCLLLASPSLFITNPIFGMNTVLGNSRGSSSTSHKPMCWLQHLLSSADRVCVCVLNGKRKEPYVYIYMYTAYIMIRPLLERFTAFLLYYSKSRLRSASSFFFLAQYFSTSSSFWFHPNVWY